MIEMLDGHATDHLQRQLRVVAILHGAAEAGLDPLPLLQFHNIAYFADALAPVWGLRILDAQLLKRREGALSPTFQRDVDRLVGRGVVRPTDVSHRLDLDGAWRLDADYSLNPLFAPRIIAAIAAFEETAAHLDFVVELVHAMSALGFNGIAGSARSDAAYGDQMADFGTVVNIGGDSRGLNATARVALRFGSLLAEDLRLTSAEMIHLYVRELYKRLEDVA